MCQGSRRRRSHTFWHEQGKQWFQIMPTAEVMLGSFLMNKMFSLQLELQLISTWLSSRGSWRQAEDRQECLACLEQYAHAPCNSSASLPDSSFHESAGWSHGSPNNTKDPTLSMWRHVAMVAKVWHLSSLPDLVHTQTHMRVLLIRIMEGVSETDTAYSCFLWP